MSSGSAWFKRLASSFVVASLLATTPAFAQDGDAKKADDEKAEKKSGDPNAGPDGQIRKDPKGIKGISPYDEKMAAGRNAFVAKNHAGAIEAFKAAIALDGEKMDAYVLLAQVHSAKGDHKSAKATLESGRTKKGQEGIQSKLLMMAGMNFERSADANRTNQGGTLSPVLKSTWDAAKQRWSAYKVFLIAHSGAPDHGATADERNKKIDDRVKRVEEYAIVVKRIADNAKNRNKKK